MQKLNLPVHEHPLYQVGGNQIQGNIGVLLICDGCYEDAHLDSGYRCSQCWGFYLHKKCGDSVPEINHPSHPDHPLHLLIGSECQGKRCHLCGVDLKALICYHCSICDFTLDTGCAINPPLPVIQQPKAHKHSLTLTSSTDYDTASRCHVCNVKQEYKKYLYSCSVCDLFFHIECASLSPDINHPSHPRHLLKLIKGGSSVNLSNCCTLCGLDIKQDQNCYHCSICNFTVDLDCVKNPPPLALVSPKTHKHELTCMPRHNRFTCNACGKQGDQSPYVCSQCNFMVHRSCIDLPRVIWINRHDHRISHTYDLDAEIGNLDMECKICRQAVHPSYGAYFCLKCKTFVVHSRCATKYIIWDGRDLEGEPEEIEDVSPFKVIGDNLIEHFSHEEHGMELVKDETVKRETIACKACIKPISAERFYKCMQCDYFLHEVCANLPRKIRSVLLPVKLTLVGGASYFHKIFFCSPCGRYSSGFRYIDIDDKDYVVELQCILTTEETRIREAHPHHLYYFASEPLNQCSSCNEKVTYGYRCLKGDCVFSLCFKCASFPERVKHKADDHTLRLCYQEYGKGKYWCDICEKEVDSHKQYYTCDDCGTTFHIKCVLGDLFGSISPGSKIWLDSKVSGKGWEFEVVANISVNRPLCCMCHSRCTFSLVFVIHVGIDMYVCSRDCLSKLFSSG